MTAIKGSKSKWSLLRSPRRTLGMARILRTGPARLAVAAIHRNRDRLQDERSLEALEYGSKPRQRIAKARKGLAEARFFQLAHSVLQSDLRTHQSTGFNRELTDRLDRRTHLLRLGR